MIVASLPCQTCANAVAWLWNACTTLVKGLNTASYHLLVATVAAILFCATRAWLSAMQAIAQALLEGECFSTTVATTITAETGASFEVIEGCERYDASAGDASGSTDGSTAEGVRSSPLCPTFTSFAFQSSYSGPCFLR